MDASPIRASLYALPELSQVGKILTRFARTGLLRPRLKGFASHTARLHDLDFVPVDGSSIVDRLLSVKHSV